MMTKAISIIGWVLALTALAFVLLLYLESEDLTARISALELENDSLQAQVAQFEQVQDQVAEAEARTDALAAEVEEARAMVAELDEGQEEEVEAPDEDEAPPEEEASEAETEFEPVTETAEAPQQPETPDVEQAPRTQVDAFYGELLAELELPPDTAQQVQRVLTDLMREEFQMQRQALTRGATGQQLREMRADVRARARQALSPLLTPRQLAQWEAFEEVKQERAYARNLERQMAMLAPSLPERARETAAEVLAEEWALAQEALLNANQPLTPQAQAQVAPQAYQAAREHLQQELSQQDFAALEQLLGQLMGRQSFGGMQAPVPRGR